MKSMGYFLSGLLMLVMISGCGSGFEWFPGTPTALTINTKTLPNATIGTAYSQQLSASGGKSPYTWSLTAGATLPAGLTMASSGVISGTPSSAAVTSSFSVTVTDSASSPTSATQTLTITISIPLTVTSTSLPSATIGTAYSATLTASGGATPYTFAVTTGSLPAGLSLNAATGAITGTPTTAALLPGSFTITVTDSSSPKASATQALIIGGLLGGSIQGKALVLTNTVSTLAGSAGQAGSADGTGSVARFSGPMGVTTDGVNLYVSDGGNHTIRQIVIATGAVTTMAGQADVAGSADGVGIAATFNTPSDITTDGTNLYVTDSSNNVIRQIVIATKKVTTIAGTVGVPGSADGVGLSASFNRPYGITMDSANLYVTDQVDNTIRQFALASQKVTTLAGTAGTTGSANGIGAAASFDGPAGLTTNGANLYVVEQNSGTIRKVVITSGAVTTFAGTAGVTGAADGVGPAASFNFPSGVSTDGTNLYVADYGNNTIRKIVIATGTVTTIAGTAGISGAADATGSAASFNSPASSSTDGSSLYITDQGNATIRKIQ